MSATEGLFFSALQPPTAVTTYAVPSDQQVGTDHMTRAKRVQQQVQQRLAEKAASLPRLAGAQSACPGMETVGLGEGTLCADTVNCGIQYWWSNNSSEPFHTNALKGWPISIHLHLSLKAHFYCWAAHHCALAQFCPCDFTLTDDCQCV